MAAAEVSARTWIVSTASGAAGRWRRWIEKSFPGERVIPTQGPGDIPRRLSRWNGGGTAVIVGGDGAWRQALQAASARTLLALLPAGTLSQAGVELGVDAGAMGRGPWSRTRVQVGRLRSGEGGAVFFLMAGVGVEAEAAVRVRPGLKRRLGKWAYVGALIERLLRPVRRNIVVCVNGHRFRTSQVLVQNGACYGGRYRVADTDVFTPGYRALIWKYPGRFMWCLTMLCCMLGLPAGRLLHDIPASKLRIRGLKGVRCQLDGDPGPGLPLHILPTRPRKIAVARGD